MVKTWKKSTGLVHVGFSSYSVVFEDYRSIITYGDDAVEIGASLVAVAYTGSGFVKCEENQ